MVLPRITDFPVRDDIPTHGLEVRSTLRSTIFAVQKPHPTIPVKCNGGRAISFLDSVIGIVYHRAASWCVAPFADVGSFFCMSVTTGIYPCGWFPRLAFVSPCCFLERCLRLVTKTFIESQWISHEMDVRPTEEFLKHSGVTGSFSLVPIPYPNHSAAWILRDIPERARARRWLHDAVMVKER